MTRSPGRWRWEIVLVPAVATLEAREHLEDLAGAVGELLAVAVRLGRSLVLTRTDPFTGRPR